MSATGLLLALLNQGSRRAHRAMEDRRLRRALAQGAQIGENFDYSAVPDFGSEPFLVSIGNNVSIANGVQFITHDGSIGHFEKIGLLKRGEIISAGRITIHDDSAIGANVIILPGVSIGPRALVGAGSVVRRDVPPNSVVVGNPARFTMTFDALVEHLRRSAPDHDPGALAADPQAELLRLFPRPW